MLFMAQHQTTSTELRLPVEVQKHLGLLGPHELKEFMDMSLCESFAFYL